MKVIQERIRKKDVQNYSEAGMMSIFGVNGTVKRTCLQIKQVFFVNSKLLVWTNRFEKVGI